jgi:hypothetical protein
MWLIILTNYGKGLLNHKMIKTLSKYNKLIIYSIVEGMIIIKAKLI